jgi:hypothetical protein
LAYGTGQVRRHLSLKMHARFGPRMIECEFPGVQHGPRNFSGAAGAILSISQNGMTEMLKMDANLVSASTVQTALEQRRIRSAAHHPKIGARIPTALARDRHLLPLNAMSPNRSVNGPGISPQFSGDEREINLLNRAGGELAGEIEMGGIVFRDDQATTCSLVEPMNDSRPLLAADPGKILAMSEERVH